MSNATMRGLAHGRVLEHRGLPCSHHVVLVRGQLWCRRCTLVASVSAPALLLVLVVPIPSATTMRALAGLPVLCALEAILHAAGWTSFSRSRVTVLTVGAAAWGWCLLFLVVMHGPLAYQAELVGVVGVVGPAVLAARLTGAR